MSDSSRRRTGLSPFAVAAVAVGMLAVGTGGAVAGGLITGAKIKDGTVTGADIRNNSLTAADLLDESRAWGKTSTTPKGPFTATEWTPIVSRAVSVPRAGYLQVTGDLYAEDLASGAGLGSLFYTIKVDGKIINTGDYRRLQYGSENSENHGENGSATVTVKVAKGSHTISLVAKETGAGSYTYGGSINALYAPTGSAAVTYVLPRSTARTANR
ncbi:MULTISPECIES: hypothetical protein [unclassified Nocardioides]|uniref:hypothetical protein n=1 Tax=unclassified Nocardioides TaxID=2615069 RepID=UPI000703346B|nr:MULTISPECIES: hypothetical protein [unclassified Nocardioides]KRC52986.1 hypothetical protein ASE19_11355 [Nocardioides sp. Root79]KRC72515.1 hypothetical protein ASE20_07885 [Nocardioides sp. Root240]